MNKFKVGDKIKVKENFWELTTGVYANDDKKKLAGRTLEVVFVHNNGNVYTKQDDSNDDTKWTWSKDWLELCNPIITWDTLKWKDVVVDGGGGERMVLVATNDVVLLSRYNDFITAGCHCHKQELQTKGYTIKQPTPPVEKLELTLGQVVEKFVADITNIKIKK